MGQTAYSIAMQQMKDMIAKANLGGVALEKVNEQLAETVSTISNAVVGHDADPTGASDSTLAIQAAVNAAMTTEHTETIPTQGAKATVYLPAGRYRITESIQVPSYISIVGAGRHATFLDSYITNGDPVIHIVQDPGSEVEQFYNSVEGLTINGRNQQCQGIKLESTIRWVLRDVMVLSTRREGIYIYDSYLGDAYSVFLSLCGDSTHDSLVITGHNTSYGGNGVQFVGGELKGYDGLTRNGVYLQYGYSTKFIGTTIEGFATGAGIVNENGIAAVVSGCYFEKNKEHIVETGPTFSSNYIGNMFGFLADGARGHIGINYAQGARIEGNFFFTPATVKIFDSTSGGTGRLELSSVRNNSAPTYPISISASLLASAIIAGTTIESFDTNASYYVQGQRRYNNHVQFDAQVRATAGIQRIGVTGALGTASSPSILGGAGSPENNIPANPGSLYLRTNGGANTTLYVKESGTGATGWVAK